MFGLFVEHIGSLESKRQQTPIYFFKLGLVASSYSELG